jgi:hypothetical protein
MQDNNDIFKGIEEFPICLRKTKFVETKKFIFGAPNTVFQCNYHRIISYYKPVSKLFQIV